MAHKTIALAIELRERWPYFPILLLPKAKFPGDKRLTFGPYEILQSD